MVRPLRTNKGAVLLVSFLHKRIIRSIGAGASICILLIGNIQYGTASTSIIYYTDEQIADAIYCAEGGARWGYGIQKKYWHYNNLAEARKICLNTIRNNRVRFAKQNKYTNFIEFLGSRYCPVGANNDKGKNKYWVRNVKHFLKTGGKYEPKTYYIGR